MLRCRGNVLYTGWTNNLEKRVLTHSEGLGGKFTHSHRPLELVWFDCYADKSEAMRREVQIKQLTRSGKDELISSLDPERKKEIERINAFVRKSVRDR
jgi:putative endonuclease